MSAAGISDAVTVVSDRTVALMKLNTSLFPDPEYLDTPELRALVEAFAQAMLESMEVQGDTSGALLVVQELP